MKIAHWLLIVSAWVGLAGLIHWLHQRAPEGAFTQAQFTTQSAQSGPWQPVMLPHDWHSAADSDHAATGWYRMQISVATLDPEPQALLLWQISMNAAVTFNGERIGDGGAMGDPVAHNWFRPLLFTIPGSLLRQGSNELLVEVRGVPLGSGFLGPVYFGKLSQLQPAFETRHFLIVTFLQLMCVLFVAMALPTGILWLKRPADSIYACHAAAALTSALYIFVLVAKNLPGAGMAPFWELMRVSSIGFSIVCITMLIHRYLGITRTRVERVLWSVEIAGVATLVGLGYFKPDLMHALVNRVWEPLVVGVGGYPAVLMFKAYAAKPDRPGFWLMLTGNLLLILGIHDLLMINRLWPPFDGFYVTYAAAGPLVAFTGILLERFLNALREAETLNRELADRVAEKSAELQRSYEEQKGLESARVVAEERSRILMDMHDGIGGRLVSMLARLENSGQSAEPIVEQVREALADLRLIIYSLEPSAQQLCTALALMRDRLEPVCEGAGLQVQWRLGELPEEYELGPRKTLQLLRLIQEAVTNVLKHAKASCLGIHARIETHDTASDLLIEIKDDGVGLPQSVPSGGKGLESMRQRARRLQASLMFEPADPGLRIVLRMPLTAGS